MAEWLKDFASTGLKMKTSSVLLVAFGKETMFWIFRGGAIPIARSTFNAMIRAQLLMRPAPVYIGD
jgi:hypothetical protein